MPYVQFTARHYINDRLYEAGERAWLGDEIGLTDSMIDLGAQAKAAAPNAEEQKAAMDRVVAERKAVDEAAANEIAMEMAVERTRTEAAEAEAKAAEAEAAKATAAERTRTQASQQQRPQAAETRAAPQSPTLSAAQPQTQHAQLSRPATVSGGGNAATAAAQTQVATEADRQRAAQGRQDPTQARPAPPAPSDPNTPAFIDHRQDEPGPQGVGTIQRSVSESPKEA